jgi:hypothetical protein
MDERDEAMIDRAIERVAGKIGDWARFGYVEGVHSMTPRPAGSGRRCDCGCKSRATHFGLSDGLVMMSGCELRVRRWVRDGYMIRNPRAK